MDKKERIDLVVMRKMPHLTRTTIKNLIINGAIQFDGEKVMPNRRIDDESKIEFNNSEIEKFLKTEEHSEILKPYDLKLDIVYEDEETLVINKPNGINSHPENRNDNKSLLNAISYYLINNPQEENRKARLVNRLDKETSGVILVAKTLPALDFYSKQFQNREVQKSYIAIVEGDFETISPRTVSNYISKNNSSKKVEVSKTGDYAETRFENLSQSQEYSLVLAMPRTGRTHQIRVHLASLDFPILGDEKYGGKRYKRMMLHSYKLKLKLLKNKSITEFTTVIPKEFSKLTSFDI